MGLGQTLLTIAPKAVYFSDPLQGVLGCFIWYHWGSPWSLLVLPKETEEVSPDGAAECLPVEEQYSATHSWCLPVALLSLGREESLKPTGPFALDESKSSQFCLPVCLSHPKQKKEISGLAGKESISPGCSLLAGFLIDPVFQVRQASLMLSERLPLDLGRTDLPELRQKTPGLSNLLLSEGCKMSSLCIVTLVLGSQTGSYS